MMTTVAIVVVALLLGLLVAVIIYDRLATRHQRFYSGWVGQQRLTREQAAWMIYHSKVRPVRYTYAGRSYCAWHPRNYLKRDGSSLDDAYNLTPLRFPSSRWAHVCSDL